VITNFVSMVSYVNMLDIYRTAIFVVVWILGNGDYRAVLKSFLSIGKIDSQN